MNKYGELVCKTKAIVRFDCVPEITIKGFKLLCDTMDICSCRDISKISQTFQNMHIYVYICIYTYICIYLVYQNLSQSSICKLGTVRDLQQYKK